MKLLWSFKYVINIILQIRYMGCYKIDHSSYVLYLGRPQTMVAPEQDYLTQSTPQ
jgi:hypothetical protein